MTVLALFSHGLYFRFPVFIYLCTVDCKLIRPMTVTKN